MCSAESRFFSQGNPGVYDFENMIMKLNKISDRIFYLPLEETTDRPVLGYIRGDKYSLAVDAGNSPAHVEKFYNAIQESNLELPEFTVITHWHWDHTFGMHAVSGKTIACNLTNEKLKQVKKWKWTDDAMKDRLQSGEDIEMCDRCIRLEYSDPTDIKVVSADIVFSQKIGLDLGGVYCEVREFQSTHSIDSVLIHVPEEKTVFIGDANSGDYYNNDGRYDKSKLREMIEVFEVLDVDIIMEGHAGPQSKFEIIQYLKDELGE